MAYPTCSWDSREQRLNAHRPFVKKSHIFCFCLKQHEGERMMAEYSFLAEPFPFIFVGREQIFLKHIRPHHKENSLDSFPNTIRTSPSLERLIKRVWSPVTYG